MMDEQSPPESRRRVEIRVEDDRTGMSPETLRRAVLDHLNFTCAKDLKSATKLDVCFAVCHTVRDRLVKRWMATQRRYAEVDPKRIYYLSAEFLLGRALASNLLNLGLLELAADGLREYGRDLQEIIEEETDPGLGNGGLGRLAACFLDSMATLALPGYGYGIRYEFGIFRQEIIDGRQVEQPDEWLRYGNPWEIARPEYTVPVHFGGRVAEIIDIDGNYHTRWVDTSKVLGVPYDTPIAGFGNNTVNTLRLWAAKASEEFDLQVFNDGDYRRAVEEKAVSESISKVLYPNDNSPEGKELRFKQQYFFVCCSIHDIVRRYKRAHATLDQLHEKCAIQLNDTHPAIAVAELMRVLIDNEGLKWDQAWHITQKTFGYTNHTLLPEALEKWPLELFEKLLPRHVQIIYEINHRFLKQVHIFAPWDEARKARMSIIDEGPPKQIRMAHLSVVGSHSVNGVAELHSQLVQQNVLRDFAEMWPDRFNNKTNGVTPRRWLLQCNPLLAAAITRRIGSGWVTDLQQLSKLAELEGDTGFLQELREIKQANKDKLARIVASRHGVELDPGSIFDVQVKRIHEYKRQLMAALHTVALYRRIKFDGEQIVPRTVIIGGKAAPGYWRAKQHIKLISDIAEIINSDPTTSRQLKCLFIANYNVSLAEHIIPAADLSEQISMAGKEASGTGNMKFQMNGALTVGTLDGANIEIREEVGAESFFLFGLNADEVRDLKAGGYNPSDYIARSEALNGAIELIEQGFFSPGEPARYHELCNYLRHTDPYLICADFDSYLAVQHRAAEAYTDAASWSRMALANIAHSGKFSSDRTIKQYADEIWGIESIPIELD